MLAFASVTLRHIPNIPCVYLHVFCLEGYAAAQKVLQPFTAKAVSEATALSQVLQFGILAMQTRTVQSGISRRSSFPL